MLQKERLDQERNLKQETVERIMRANEYKRQQIMQKILEDDQRSKRLMREKSELLESRRVARDNAAR